MTKTSNYPSDTRTRRIKCLHHLLTSLIMKVRRCFFPFFFLLVGNPSCGAAPVSVRFAACDVRVPFSLGSLLASETSDDSSRSVVAGRSRTDKDEWFMPSVESVSSFDGERDIDRSMRLIKGLSVFDFVDGVSVCGTVVLFRFRFGDNAERRGGRSGDFMFLTTSTLEFSSSNSFAIFL